jgi:O-methyltransferase/8-demethyl-8-(2,3-dimethoxy-alpha-L-rhamnosyl)tetracenomycin-C 4'-O-methyltransferase
MQLVNTLPAAPIDRLAVLRLDGDMHESAMQALEALYRKVSFNGFATVDDFHFAPCKTAILDFRKRHDLAASILPIDRYAVWWRVDHPPISA